MMVLKTIPYALAAVSALAGGGGIPFFVITCGTDDWLYSRNLSFIRKLEEEGIPFRFIPVPGGGHGSECFQEGLWKAFGEIETGAFRR